MIINASVQVVPLTEAQKAYSIIDQAIALIQQSGLKYTVGALATDIEGEYAAVQQLIAGINDLCYSKNDTPFLIYTKLHLCGGKDIWADDKTAKFR